MKPSTTLKYMAIGSPIVTRYECDGEQHVLHLEDGWVVPGSVPDTDLPFVSAGTVDEARRQLTSAVRKGRPKRRAASGRLPCTALLRSVRPIS